jgi:hypothetical protein
MRPTGNQTSSHSLDSAEIQTGPKAHRVHAIATPLISKVLHGTDSSYSCRSVDGRQRRRSARQFPPRSTPLTFSGKPRPSIREKHLSVACLVFPRQDHIAFTAPFEVFSRIPDVTVQVIAKTKDPVRDVKVSFSPPIRRPPRRLRWTSCSCRAVWESRH